MLSICASSCWQTRMPAPGTGGALEGRSVGRLSVRAAARRERRRRPAVRRRRAARGVRHGPVSRPRVLLWRRERRLSCLRRRYSGLRLSSLRPLPRCVRVVVRPFCRALRRWWRPLCRACGVGQDCCRLISICRCRRGHCQRRRNHLGPRRRHGSPQRRGRQGFAGRRPSSGRRGPGRRRVAERRQGRWAQRAPGPRRKLNTWRESRRA